MSERPILHGNLTRSIKEWLKDLHAQQLAGTYDQACPRCGYGMDLEKMARNSLSRYEQIYICSNCGMDEALREHHGAGQKPLVRWAIASAFEGKEYNAPPQVYVGKVFSVVGPGVHLFNGSADAVIQTTTAGDILVRIGDLTYRYPSEDVAGRSVEQLYEDALRYHTSMGTIPGRKHPLKLEQRRRLAKYLYYHAGSTVAELSAATFLPKGAVTATLSSWIRNRRAAFAGTNDCGDATYRLVIA